MDKRLEMILCYMSDSIKTVLKGVFQNVGTRIQEIRIRCQKPLSIVTENGNFFVTKDGLASTNNSNLYIVDTGDIRQIFTAICENSVYAYSEDIRQGFVTIRGGHRVGITGRAVVANGRVEGFRDVSSLNIRVAKEVIGAADGVMAYIMKEGKIKNTLIVAPPLGGKTTILRDLTRQISNFGFKTAVVDERGEIASIFQGVPQNDVGVHTDVVENTPKKVGMSMLLRTMSPQVIVTDEIATKEDVESLRECFGTGVSVVATAHGDGPEDIKKRQFLKKVLGGGGFEQIIFLKRTNKECFEASFDVAVVEK